MQVHPPSGSSVASHTNVSEVLDFLRSPEATALWRSTYAVWDVSQYESYAMEQLHVLAFVNGEGGSVSPLMLSVTIDSSPHANRIALSAEQLNEHPDADYIVVSLTHKRLLVFLPWEATLRWLEHRRKTPAPLENNVPTFALGQILDGVADARAVRRGDRGWVRFEPIEDRAPRSGNQRGQGHRADRRHRRPRGW